uniref:Uncharacterized protein n=1 Tax=Globodera rostochiensis TaxID=31243 RepID=A0A914HPT3_GLORO
MANFRLFFLLFLLLLSFNISTTQNRELDNKDEVSPEVPRPSSQFRVNEPLYGWMGGAVIVLLLLALLVVAAKLFRNHKEKRRGRFCPGESPKVHIDHKQQLPYLSSFRTLGGEDSDQSLRLRHQIHKFRSRRFHLFSAVAAAVVRHAHQLHHHKVQYTRFHPFSAAAVATASNACQLRHRTHKVWSRRLHPFSATAVATMANGTTTESKSG